MRRVLFGVVFALLANAAVAQVPESTTQMSLANSQKFITRLQYLMGQQARTVLAETPPAQCSQPRIAFAQAVIADTHQQASHAAPIIVGGVNLIGTVVSDPDPNKIDSSATDASILSQTATFWNALAKCATGS